MLFQSYCEVIQALCTLKHLASGKLWPESIHPKDEERPPKLQRRTSKNWKRQLQSFCENFYTAKTCSHFGGVYIAYVTAQGRVYTAPPAPANIAWISCCASRAWLFLGIQGLAVLGPSWLHNSRALKYYRSSNSSLPVSS